MNNMSFNQFYTVEAKRHVQRCGGYTDPRPVNPNDLDVWAKVLALPGTELAAKAPPTSVQTAVVSGVKFRFIFKDGSTVTVWRSWQNVITIVNH